MYERSRVSVESSINAQGAKGLFRSRQNGDWKSDKEKEDSIRHCKMLERQVDQLLEESSYKQEKLF